METIKTQFTTHEEAEEWAIKEGYTIIMSSLKDGHVSLMVTK